MFPLPLGEGSGVRVRSIASDKSSKSFFAARRAAKNKNFFGLFFSRQLRPSPNPLSEGEG
jgi:hypothetical protein